MTGNGSHCLGCRYRREGITLVGVRFNKYFPVVTDNPTQSANSFQACVYHGVDLCSFDDNQYRFTVRSQDLIFTTPPAYGGFFFF